MRPWADSHRSLRWLAVLLVVLGWMPGAAAQTDIPASVLTTASLAKGVAQTGTIDRAGDADWYKLVLREANAYRIEVTGPAEIRIYDHAGTLKASGGTKRYYVWGAPLTGTYFIAAQGKGSQTGAYTVKVSVSDHAASPSSDGKMIIGKTTTGRMTNTGPVEFFGSEAFPADEDWLAFQLRTAGCYLLEAWMDSRSDWLELYLYEEFGFGTGNFLPSYLPHKQCSDINPDGSRIGCTGSRGILLEVRATSPDPQRYFLSLLNQPVHRTAGGPWHARLTRRPDLEFRQADSSDVLCHAP